MSVIHRDIYLTWHQRIQPIDIVRGSQVGIELQLMDYDIPAGATAKAYARGRYAPNTYKADCTISEKTVSFTPPEGFFIPGPNRLQIEINGVIIPFSIDVNCETRISEGGGATPEKVKPLVERAEAAAEAAEQSQEAVEAIRAELEENNAKIPELCTQIDGMEKSLITDNGLNIAAAHGSFEDTTHNGITYSWNDDHTECTVNGTATDNSFNTFMEANSALPYGLEENEEVYFDVSTTNNDAYIRVYFLNAAGERFDTKIIRTPMWVSVPEGATGSVIRVQIINGSTVVNDVVSVKVYKNLPNSLLQAEIEKRIYSKSAKPYLSGDSLTLGDIREDGYYVIDTTWTLTDAPAGFAPTGLTVENFSDRLHGNGFVKQTIEKLFGSSDKRYYRYSNVNGVFGEWKEDAENFLAAPDDDRDMTGTIQAMLDTTGVCRLGPGVFYVTGVNIPTGGMLTGSGNATRLVLAESVASGYAAKINTYGCIKDLMIGGTRIYDTQIAGLSEVIGERHGILFQGAASTNGNVPKRSTVHNVTIYNFTGGGITCTDTGYSVASCMNVSDVFVFWCGVGINIPYWSEFHRFTNVSADMCYYGCINNGGNNVFANCGFSKNTVGVLMDNSAEQSTNNSHGTYTGCVFNHSGGNTGIAIKLLGIKNGELFNACQLFYGGIVIDGCEGVRLECFNVGRQALVSVSNSKGIILNGWIVRSEEDAVITKDDISTVFISNCYTKAGAPFGHCTGLPSQSIATVAQAEQYLGI